MCLLLILSIGCSKSDSITAPSSKMSAKVNGSEFSTNGVTMGGDGVFLSIEGSNGKDAILLYIDNYHGKGTYPVGTDWTVPTQYRDGGKAKYAVRGFATISATSPDIKGSFYFICEDSTEISAGSFSVSNE